MNSSELRDKFLKYFESKGHRIVPSGSLLPEDHTVLLTTAGMQQFVPYLSGSKDVLSDFSTRHLYSSQKCFRTVDIDNVGDDTHHTFFEMLGNWSIGTDEEGRYFKAGAIKYALDFLVNVLGLDQKKIYITIFSGENGIARDDEADKLWQDQGIPGERIFDFGSEDNFWGPTATTGPCGPCSEIHYDRGSEYGCTDGCSPNCDQCQRYVEIWNLVFMEYHKDESGNYSKLPQTNIDTGIGFERLLSLLNNVNSSYETDIFSDFIALLEDIAGVKYTDNQKEFRIMADHIRSSVFLIADGIRPGNVTQGYILRRLLRRAIRVANLLKLPDGFLADLSAVIVAKYGDVYPETEDKNILAVMEEEKEKFELTLENGLREFDKLDHIDGKIAFNLYSSYGFPLELSKELAKEKGIEINEKDFYSEFTKHQKISRTATAGRFKGGLADTNPETIRLHTAHHLLLAALQQVLGDHVKQRGSNITSDRLRIDFVHPDKLTPEQLKKVEDIVNSKIEEGLNVVRREMPKDDAKKIGAEMEFGGKYGDIVSVYFIEDEKGNAFSKEFCGGPHLKNTREIGHFKIKKEESSSAGVRRIKAVVE